MTRTVRTLAAMACAAGTMLGTMTTGALAQDPAGHRLDWLNFGETTASPYLSDIHALVDGDLESLCEHMHGPQAGGWIEFAFPEAIHVTALRLMQASTRPANAFELRADQDGKGAYPEVVAKIGQDVPVVDAWIVIPVDRPVRGLRIAALSGSVGYRSGYPVYKQIEIYSREKVAVPAMPAEAAPAGLAVGDDTRAPDLGRKDIHFTPCIDLWMAGISSGDQMPETKAEIEALEGFQNLLRTLRTVDAQGIRMFLETGAVENKMPWKSNLANSYGRDTLRGVMAALHAQGLTGSIFLHAWMSPFQPPEKMLPMPDRRWDYPYEQSDLVAAKGLYEGYEKGRYPCVICDHDFKSQWLGLLTEGVERGLDGVYVLPDEYYFKGHDLDTFDCPSCRREFQQRYGYDHLPKLGPGRSGYSAGPGVGPEPRRAADTEHFRKWKLFEYEMLAKLFDDVAGQLKAINPNLALVSSANPASTYVTNRRLEHGLAFDIMGRGENATAIQLYGSVPVGLGHVGIHTALARRMAGSFRHADLSSSIQALEFKDLPPAANEIRLLGYVLPHVMAGAKRIDLYRLNYVDGEWLPVVSRSIAMVRILESWGIGESVSAADTCLLLSRASEDWWQVRAQSLMGLGDGAGADMATAGGAPLLHFEEQIGTISTLSPGEAELKLDFERFRGMYAGKGMESMLIENGIQYDVRHTEREETLGDIGKYRLLLLPFSYAMSKDAFAKVKAAVDGGSKLLIYDQLAPADEFGNPHPEPLLTSLIGHPNVAFLDRNLAVDGMRPAVRREARTRMLDMLGEPAGYFNGNGARLEYLSRRTGDGMILYLANWEKEKVARPVLGLPPMDGNYRLTVVTGNRPELREARIGGKDVVAAADLKRFSVQVAPGEVMLIKVGKATP
jgi:hypothetical protein